MGRLNNFKTKTSVLTHVELKVTFSLQRSNFTPSHHDHSAETKTINDFFLNWYKSLFSLTV